MTMKSVSSPIASRQCFFADEEQQIAFARVVAQHLKSSFILLLKGDLGAGKTTFFNCISGIHQPTKGDMFISTPEKKRKNINVLKRNRVTERGKDRKVQQFGSLRNRSDLETCMIRCTVRISLVI